MPDQIMDQIAKVRATELTDITFAEAQEYVGEHKSTIVHVANTEYRVEVTGIAEDHDSIRLLVSVSTPTAPALFPPVPSVLIVRKR